jgi:accessory gene regulator protein AgrB
MIKNHDRSIALHTWSVICVIVSIILLVLGFFFAVFDENFSVLGTGIALLMLAPVLNGLSVLVEDAEVRLLERQKKIEEKKNLRPVE